MSFRAPFRTDVYVGNRLRIADSIPPLAGTDRSSAMAGLTPAPPPWIDFVICYLQSVRSRRDMRDVTMAAVAMMADKRGL